MPCIPVDEDAKTARNLALCAAREGDRGRFAPRSLAPVGRKRSYILPADSRRLSDASATLW
jgi:hypothetical protein